MLIAALMMVSVAGCGELVAPHQAASSTTLISTGVDTDTFEEAWERLKDVFAAAAVATALSEFRSLVDDVGLALEEIDTARLNVDEVEFKGRFQAVFQAFADSVDLWTLDVERGDTGRDGIELYEGDLSLHPRADEIVETYGLTLSPADNSGIRVVPEDSVGRLWDFARRGTEEWLLPIMK